MLTPRENLLETIKVDGKPDRLVNQWEAYENIVGAPVASPRAIKGADPIQDGWGVWKVYPSNAPGAFPIHDAEHIVVKDIENWHEYVHAPNLIYPESAWEKAIESAESIDRTQKFAMFGVAPGIFEQCHYLCEISNTLLYFMENPDEMAEMIKYLKEYELTLAEQVCKYVKPDAINHHDDWGMQLSTFLRPEMFVEFFLDAYKEIYQYYHDHGVEIISHHSDSYAETLVPYMIEMGIDIWQGVLDTNNIEELLKTYGGQISFHGGLNNGIYDVENSDPDKIEEGVRELVAKSDHGKFLIPGLCAGVANFSSYPGVYDCVSEKISKVSDELFA